MSKKLRCPPFENHERWLVSYADMLTLLFAVFVVLYSISISGQKEQDQNQVAGSLQESFNTPLEEIPENRRAGPDEKGWGIFKDTGGERAIEKIFQKYPGSRDLIKVIEQDMKTVKLEIENRLYGPSKFRDREEPGQARIVSVHPANKGFRLRLLARHFYDSGSTVVKREALPDLDQIVKIVKELNRPVTIEGHTDSLPPQNGMSNWDLSAQRAVNVLKYMIQKHNFPTTRISAAGYGDAKPIAHNGTETGRALNRRIEIHVEYDDLESPVQPTEN